MYALAADRHSSSFRPKPSPIATLAGLLGKEAVQSLLDIFAACRFPSPRKVGDNALEIKTESILISRSCSIQKNPFYLFRYLLEWNRFADADVPAEPFNKPVIVNVHSLAAFAPCFYRAAVQRNTFVGYD